MAIVIPSKNIYGVENQKVRNNVINKVSYNSSRVVSKNEYNVLVHSEKLQPEVATLRNAVIKKDGKATLIPDWGVYKEAASISYKPNYATDVKIKIPKKKKNSYIEKIYKGKNSDGNFFVKCSLSGDLYIGTAKAFASYSVDDEYVTISNIETNYGSATPHSLTIDKEKADINYSIEDFQLDITDDVNNNYPIDLSAKTNYSENEEEFVFSVSFISSYELIKMYGESGFDDVQYFQIGTHTAEDRKDSYAENFYAKSIEITVNGDIIGIDIEDYNNEYGDGNKPFTVKKSELNQYSNFTKGALLKNKSKFTVKGYDEVLDGYLYYITPQTGFFRDGYYIDIGERRTKIFYINGTPHFKTTVKIGEKGDEIECYEEALTYEKNSEDIITRYKNGKETIEILCGINDYFDAKGNKKISASGELEKMTFDIGDIVIPYKHSATMVDEPISLDKYGNPKQFEVVSVKMIYDGATMQKITAQEAQ